jgi:hypothetical protein
MRLNPPEMAPEHPAVRRLICTRGAHARAKDANLDYKVAGWNDNVCAFWPWEVGFGTGRREIQLQGVNK